MNEKLLEIYDKCMEHNITITIQYLLSDASIEIVGRMLAYNSKTRQYEKLYRDKWVSIHEMKSVNNVDLITFAIDEIFDELNSRKDELLSEV